MEKLIYIVILGGWLSDFVMFVIWNILGGPQGHDQVVCSYLGQEQAKYFFHGLDTIKDLHSAV